jgi:hypothetical protein
LYAYIPNLPLINPNNFPVFSNLFSDSCQYSQIRSSCVTFRLSLKFGTPSLNSLPPLQRSRRLFSNVSQPTQTLTSIKSQWQHHHSLIVLQNEVLKPIIPVLNLPIFLLPRPKRLPQTETYIRRRKWQREYRSLSLLLQQLLGSASYCCFVDSRDLGAVI